MISNRKQKFRLSSPRQIASDDSILPLINVVFLLLVFFMLAGKLSNQQQIPIDPLLSASQLQPGQNTIELLLTRTGQLYLAGVEINREELRLAISQQSNEISEVKIHLRPDREVQATRVVEVLQWLRDLQVEQVKLLTTTAG
ncbi:MAG: biopolymer transport protein ExbD [Parasphingorhabdus sp.]